MVLDGNVFPPAYVERQQDANGGRFLPSFLRQGSDVGAARDARRVPETLRRDRRCALRLLRRQPRGDAEKYLALLERLRAGPEDGFTYASVASMPALPLTP